MSRKSRIVVMFLTAALVALSLFAVPAALAKSPSSSKALRFTVVKRTPHFDVVRGHHHRFAVRHGAHKVILRGGERYRVVRRTHRYVVLRAVSHNVKAKPTIISPNGGGLAWGVSTTVIWTMSAAVSSGFFRVSLKDTLNGASTRLTADRISTLRGATSYGVPWNVSQPVDSYTLSVDYYARDGKVISSDVSDGSLTIALTAMPTPTPTRTATPTPTPTPTTTATSTPTPTPTPTSTPTTKPTVTPTPTPTPTQTPTPTPSPTVISTPSPTVTPSSPPPPGADISVTDYGAKGDGVTDDSAAIQKAIDSRGSSGGTVVFPAGKTYRVGAAIRLPAGNTATLSLSGYGATIKLANTTPRFLVWKKTIDHQTFKKFNILGFAIDADNKHPASGHYSVLGFDMQDGGGIYDAAYLNVEEITVQDCRVYNIATVGNADNYRPAGIDIYTTQSNAGEAIWDHITDCYVQSCRVEGSTCGISIRASGPAGPPRFSVSIDRVAIRDCWHDSGVTYLSSGDGSNFHIGDDASVGKAEVTGCYGARSGDVGVEMDGASEGLVENCTIENQFWQGYYYSNYNVPLRPAAASMTWRNCRNIVSVPCAGGGVQYGYTVSMPYAYTIGTVNVENCSYDLKTNTNEQTALCISPGTVLKAYNATNIAITSVKSITPYKLNPNSGAVTLSNITLNGSQIN